MNDQVYDEASHVDARQSDVHVNGPDGIDVILTAEAAALTSDRLLHAAVKAQGQKIRARSGN
ncbi:hypothetical protein [Sphingomonas sp. PB4P5]|uniref:hypothetical protein n=1 Tax=Parasphingomonas puruogangriensis TaxID=3096155 RepID=UPI002FCA7023